MVFSSLTFIFYFLPICICVYFLLPKLNLKNSWLLFSSLGFYFWGEFEFLIVLIASIGINYLAGLILDKKKSKSTLSVAILLNLFILFYFKYASFLASSFFSTETDPTGNLTTNWWSDIHLPLGISFFTFQGISYLFDIYRNEAKVERNIFNLALYISMFPQLVAGPIVRFKTIAESIRKRTHTIDKVVHGSSLFIVGLSYKVLLANNFAFTAAKVFDLSPDNLNAVLAWIGVLAYTMQIYFDFNGYSVMAIGLGYIFGFKFPINFNYPYISKSITEFWRRWHITLSVWFRDYLYIPCGGNRKGPFRTYFNLLLVFTLCGIWHGASWIFLLWGLYQGFFLIIERLGLKRILDNLPNIVSHIYTIFIFVIGWLLFNSTDLSQFISMLKAMFGYGIFDRFAVHPMELLTLKFNVAFICGIFLSTPLIFRLLFKSEDKLDRLLASKSPNEYQSRFPFIWYILLAMLLILTVANLCNQTYNPFIYFRF